MAEKEGLPIGIGDLITIDPNGDVILECRDKDMDITKDFLVSSKILQLASPVFVGMFRPDFKEGTQLLHAGRPVIELQEDDPSTMSVILEILHFRYDIKDDDINAERLARLATHSDKYDLSRALSSWVPFWFEKVVNMIEPSDDLGLTLLAAYTFNDVEKFQAISGMALKKLSPGFDDGWESQDLMALLPTNISGWLAQMRFYQSYC